MSEGEIMGKRGPKPAATDLKVLSGTYRADRDKETPKPAPLMPEPPEWLPDGAKEIFKKQAPELVRLGILSAIDADEFGRYCLYTLRQAQCETYIEQTGILIPSAREGDGHRVKNPACQLARDYGAAASKLADKYGLNAVSRNNVSVYVKSDDDGPFDYLLSGHKGEDCSKYWK
jgi:P27 family predicted phage terminase small subunit